MRCRRSEHLWVCPCRLSVQVDAHCLRTPDGNGKHGLVGIKEEAVELLDSVNRPALFMKGKYVVSAEEPCGVDNEGLLVLDLRDHHGELVDANEIQGLHLINLLAKGSVTRFCNEPRGRFRTGLLPQEKQNNHGIYPSRDSRTNRRSAWPLAPRRPLAVDKSSGTCNFWKR